MRTILPYIIAIVFLMLFLNQCSITDDIKDQQNNTDKFLNDSTKYYKDKYGNDIAYKNALQGNLDLMLNRNEELKELIRQMKADAVGSITTITKYDTIRIGYEVPVPCEFTRDWLVKEKWYSINGTSNELGININSLEIPAKISFGIGSVRKSWFSSEYQFKATIDNPNIKITDLDGYTSKVPTKRLGIGLMAGYGISSDGLSPIVGVGLTYQLFRF